MKIDHIIDNIYLSGAIENYNELVDIGIAVVINMKAEQHDDIMALTKKRISYFYIPVPDSNAPRLDQIRQFLDLTKIFKDYKILIHCELGIGRSAICVAFYIIEKKNNTPEEALKFLQSKRPEVSMTEIQFNKLKKFWEKKNAG
jgi:protein-tyrosine phosphatase